MTEQQIAETVVRVLRDAAPDAGFQGAQVKTDTDFDGESIIRVTARYDRRPAREETLVDVVHALRSALMEQGEDRYVFLTNDIESERQRVPDED